MPVSESNFLNLLPEADRAQLLLGCKPVNLSLASILGEADSTMTSVYFPIDGFVSSIATVGDDASIEVGMVGREGIVGVSVALGIITSPVQSRVQGQGTAWKISVVDFQVALTRSSALTRHVHHYVFVQLVQYARSAACLNAHRIVQRLARWLLMTHDRAHTEDLAVTQEVLAYMLGARRESVTMAAIELQKSGFIEYRRGRMSIVDREGLESAACACYASDQRTYFSVMQ